MNRRINNFQFANRRGGGSSGAIKMRKPIVCENVQIAPIPAIFSEKSKKALRVQSSRTMATYTFRERVAHLSVVSGCCCCGSPVSYFNYPIHRRVLERHLGRLQVAFPSTAIIGIVAYFLSLATWTLYFFILFALRIQCVQRRFIDYSSTGQPFNIHRAPFIFFGRLSQSYQKGRRLDKYRLMFIGWMAITVNSLTTWIGNFRKDGDRFTAWVNVTIRDRLAFSNFRPPSICDWLRIICPVIQLLATISNFCRLFRNRSRCCRLWTLDFHMRPHRPKEFHSFNLIEQFCWRKSTTFRWNSQLKRKSWWKQKIKEVIIEKKGKRRRRRSKRCNEPERSRTYGCRSFADSLKQVTTSTQSTAPHLYTKKLPRFYETSKYQISSFWFLFSAARGGNKAALSHFFLGSVKQIPSDSDGSEREKVCCPPVGRHLYTPVGVAPLSFSRPTAKQKRQQVKSNRNAGKMKITARKRGNRFGVPICACL